MSRAERSDYWRRVRQRWDAAEGAISTERTRTATVDRSLIRSLATRFLGPEATIVITGERGAGKTELYRTLTGALPRRRVGRSDRREELRAGLRTEAQRIRSTFFVVPGQDSDPQGTSLEELFSGDRAPRGVVHLVTGGYDWVWGTRERALVEEGLLAEQRMRAEELSRLDPDQPGDADRLAELTSLQEHPLLWHLRQNQMENELRRFQELCRDYLRPAWTRPATANRPIWLIVGVVKCDLWYDERAAVRDHYLPGDATPDTSFRTELRNLVNEVGAARLAQLAVVPVASYPQPYALTPRIGEHRPALGKEETDSLVNHFRNLVGEFCGTPKH
ncbi:hypothetical protein [Plantactinospora endophytica]|uniref:hypothetical protein n=1 Tax=Plantactinospora endophytica TaxID=673535 RepID=UPI001941A2A2|nr:hypothetical protein [Plantactinospora endophytica]